MNVIFTADDYGAVPAIDKGIIKAVNSEKINSVDAFSNHPDFERNINRLLEECAGKPFEIGCHLTLTSGAPVSGQRFSYRTRNLFRRKFFTPYNRLQRANDFHLVNEMNETEYELCKQIEQFEKIGVEITHLSHHHNVMFFFKEFHHLMISIAKKFDLPMRSPLINPKPMNDTFLMGLLVQSTVHMNKTHRVNLLEHTQNIRQFMLEQSDYPRTPLATNTIFYGPAPLPLINKHVSDELISMIALEKKHSLGRDIKHPKLKEDTVEYIFHLIDDDYEQLDNFKKHNRQWGVFKEYPGVDPNYYFGRMAEQRALLDFYFPNELKMKSWKSLSS